jgi:hypothetical protein
MENGVDYFYKLIFPKAESTAVSTKSDVELTHFDDELGPMGLCADLHSHHTMGAFFSTTDDQDEINRPNILFGVFS